MLLPDLLNAFSLGLSVDLAQVWPIDWLFGALALAAAIWGVRSRQAWAAGGWIRRRPWSCRWAMPVLNEFRPLYMNARHLSLLLGPFVLLVGGAGIDWRWRSPAGPLLALALAAGSAAASGAIAASTITRRSSTPRMTMGALAATSARGSRR